MAQHAEKKENIENLYYLVGLVAGLFTGLILEMGFAYIIAGGIVGLLFAMFFVRVLVRGREDV